MAHQTTLADQVEAVMRARQTGMLTVRAVMEQNSNVSTGNPVSFAMLFKNGYLVSVHVGESNTLQGYLLLAQIATVLRSRWTPMRDDHVAETVDPKTSQALIRLLRNGGLNESKDLSNSLAFPLHQGKATIPVSDEAADLYLHAQAIFLQVFGDNGADMLEHIRSQVDVTANPVLFLRLCVDQLSPMLGHSTAVEMLMPPV